MARRVPAPNRRFPPAPRPAPPAGALAALTALLLGLAPAACGPGDEGAGAGPAPGDTASPPADTTSAPPAPGAALPLPRLLNRLHLRNEAGELPVLDELPTPRTTASRAVQNRHDPSVTDTVRTLTWDGMEMEVYHVTRSGKEIVRSLTLTAPGPRTAEGIGVGSPRSEVRAAWGDPRRAEDGASIHHLGEGEHDPTPTVVRVEYEDDRVARIRFGFYVD